MDKKKTGSKKMPEKDPHRYDNILDNQRPIARKPMDPLKRSAQFAPFAALTGYDDQVKESARLTTDPAELDENEITALDRQLQFLKEHLAEHPQIEVTYFVPDRESHKASAKDGGAYVTHTGILKKIDPYEKKVLFFDTCQILIDRIVDIDGEIFADTYDL